MDTCCPVRYQTGNEPTLLVVGCLSFFAFGSCATFRYFLFLRRRWKFGSMSSSRSLWWWCLYSRFPKQQLGLLGRFLTSHFTRFQLFKRRQQRDKKASILLLNELIEFWPEKEQLPANLLAVQDSASCAAQMMMIVFESGRH